MQSDMIQLLLPFTDDVRFGDMLNDESSFKAFLTNTLNLNDSIANAIINSTVNIENVSAHYSVYIPTAIINSYN